MICGSRNVKPFKTAKKMTAETVSYLQQLNEFTEVKNLIETLFK